MTSPVKFTLGCLGWFVFRTPSVRQFDKKSGSYYAQPDVQVTEWMNQHTNGRWAMGSGAEYKTTPYYIEDKMDAMLFKLTWCEDVVKPVFGNG